MWTADRKENDRRPHGVLLFSLSGLIADYLPAELNARTASIVTGFSQALSETNWLALPVHADIL